MRQTAATKILDYWSSLRIENGVPAASSVDPRSLKAYLPDLFMLERLDRAVFAFRLAGTRMCQRFGRELRDHDFVRLFPSIQHGDLLAQLGRALQTGEAVVVKARAATLDDDAIDAEIVLMPLTDAEGRIVRLLGALLPADDDALRHGENYIGLRLSAAVAAAEYSAAAEAAAAQVFASARETHVSFLRVVDGWKEEPPAKTAARSTFAAG